MNRWDVSGTLAKRLAVPLARLGGNVQKPAEIVSEIESEKILTRSDASWLNMVRAYAWFIVMAVVLPASLAIWLLGKFFGIWFVQAIGGFLIFLGLGSGAIALPHAIRMGVAEHIFPERAGKQKDLKLLKRVKPKRRDFYLGLILAIIIVGFLALGGLWEWTMSP